MSTVPGMTQTGSESLTSWLVTRGKSPHLLGLIPYSEGGLMAVPPDVLGKLRGSENRIDPKLGPEPATVSGKQGAAPVLDMMVSAIRNLKGTLQTQRTQGPGRRSLVVGFTAGDKPGEGRECPGRPSARAVSPPRACTRAGGEEGESPGQDWRGLGPPSPASPLGAQLACGRGRCRAGLSRPGRGGAGGRVSRELLRLPSL